MIFDLRTGVRNIRNAAQTEGYYWTFANHSSPESTGQGPQYQLCPTRNKKRFPQKGFSHQFLCPQGCTCATATKRDLQINSLNSHEQKLSSKSVLVRKPPCVECTCRGLQTCHTQWAKSLPLVSNGPKAHHKYHSGKGYVENTAVDSYREAGSIAQLLKKGGEEGKAGKYLPSI